MNRGPRSLVAKTKWSRCSASAAQHSRAHTGSGGPTSPFLFTAMELPISSTPHPMAVAAPFRQARRALRAAVSQRPRCA
eukprot:12179507-Alexandrium_andersonii.AAC.1